MPKAPASMLPRRALVAVLAFAWFLAGPAAPPARGQDAAGLSKEKLDAVAAPLRKAVDDKTVAGGSALVARYGKVVYRANAGFQDE